MITEKFSGEVANFYGKPIVPALKYEAEVTKFENIDEVNAAGEYPKSSEIVDYLNAKRKANERQKAMQRAVDNAGIQKPTLENDSQLRLKKMADIFIANGSTEAEAKASAAAALGLTWDE